MGEVGRSHGRGPAAPLLTALLAAVLLGALLTACGGSAQTAEDPLAGYWVGSGDSSMQLVHIVKQGGSYKVFANPDYEAPAPVLQDGDLVINTHAVTLTFSPAGTDRLTAAITGDSVKKPETTTLRRVSEAQYADAAVGLGLTTIRRALSKWKAGGGKKYPPASEVTPTGALGQMTSWPKNLFTGQPMQPGTGKGDYVYKTLDGGSGYSLVAYLSDGSTIGK